MSSAVQLESHSKMISINRQVLPKVKSMRVLSLDARIQV